MNICDILNKLSPVLFVIVFCGCTTPPMNHDLKKFGFVLNETNNAIFRDVRYMSKSIDKKSFQKFVYQIIAFERLNHYVQEEILLFTKNARRDGNYIIYDGEAVDFLATELTGRQQWHFYTKELILKLNQLGKIADRYPDQKIFSDTNPLTLQADISINNLVIDDVKLSHTQVLVTFKVDSTIGNTKKIIWLFTWSEQEGWKINDCIHQGQKLSTLLDDAIAMYGKIY
jgi:hypothetical protein